jgi:parvulin-like peptidyl-prolyl isomerase
MRAIRSACAGIVLASAMAISPAARAELATGIKAIVHDSVITYEDVEDLTDEPAAALRREYANNPQEFSRRLEKAREQNLQKLVGDQLILHEFKTAGYSLPDSVIDDVVQNRIRALFGDRRKAAQTLQARGLSIEKFRQHERDHFIIQAMRNKNISQEIIVSPHKLEAYYAAHKDDFNVEEQVKWRSIVLHKTVISEPDQIRKKGEEICSRLKDGAVFAELATIYSEGPDAKQGGARGLQPISQLREELQAAVAKLKPGESSGLIETADSFWIVEVDQKEAAHVKPIGEVREQIERELVLAERKRLEDAWIAKLRKKTFVQFF